MIRLPDLRAKFWLQDINEVEEGAFAQIVNMTQLPGLQGDVAVMPDVHLGMGACIGTVFATNKCIVPVAVGVDIGCGMAAYQTHLKWNDSFDEDGARRWFMEVSETIPAGMGRVHATVNMADFYDTAGDVYGLKCREMVCDELGLSDFNHKVAQAWGTLGGGNHFIELLRDEDNHIWVMIHSGSRGIGYKVASHYIKEARRLNDLWFTDRPEGLDILPMGTKEFSSYYDDVVWCQNFAKANRKKMMQAALAALDITMSLEYNSPGLIDTCHNYVQFEHHGNKNVLVHRKGAVGLKEGELGTIPGSMGTSSYIVRGKGVTEAFNSCSHGAGRSRSRKATKALVSMDAFKESMQDTLTPICEDLIDESPFGYKDIDHVMSSQEGILVDTVFRLKPIITLKGTT